MVNTNGLTPKASFINDRARYLAQPGDTVHVSVELVICHQEPENEPVEYTFCRKVTAERQDNGADWHDDQAWRVEASQVELCYREGPNLRIVDDREGFEQKLSPLFPREIRNYVWFQGEALDKLIDFSNRKTFEDAIRYISYYPRYETLSGLIEQATDIIEKERNKKQRAATSDKKQFDEKTRNLENRKTTLKRLRDELETLEEQKATASQSQEEAEERLKALQEFPPLEKRKAQAEADLNAARRRIDEEIDRQKKHFQTVWLLKGVSGLMEEAKRRMQDYEDQRNSNAKYVLPADVPPKVFMEKMLAAEQCLVCGTDAPIGSAPHGFIKARIAAQETHFRQLKDNQELYSTVQRLLDYPDEVTLTVAGIGEQIGETEDRIDAARRQRQAATETVQAVQAELDSLLRKYQMDNPSQAELQISKYTSLSHALSDLRVRIERKKKEIEEHEHQIKRLETELSTLSANPAASIPEVRWHKLASFMETVVQTVKAKAKTDMIYQIEQKANEYYANITKHNRAVDGKISIDKETYKITRTEADQYTVTNVNMGNFTLMKMCIINAMLSLNEQAFGVAYPFIADAPTSNLDDETTIAYLKSLAGTFGQSIIITKDISQFRFDEVKADRSVKTIHALETHTENPEAERLTQYEAYTRIKRIK